MPENAPTLAVRKAELEQAKSELLRLDAEPRRETIPPLVATVKESRAAYDAAADAVRRAEELRDSLIRQTALVDYLQGEQARKDSIRNATAAQEPSTMQQRTAPEQQLLSTGALLLDNCYFETGKTTVSINSKPYLNLIARMLTKYPKLRIEVAGHTDDVGGLNYNMNLSRLRAEAVMLYMTSVAPELRLTLTSQGYGPTRPWISNRTEEGRKYNRRTELRVLNKEMLQEYK